MTLWFKKHFDQLVFNQLVIQLLIFEISWTEKIINFFEKKNIYKII